MSSGVHDLYGVLFSARDGYFVPPEYRADTPIRSSLPAYRKWKNPAKEIVGALCKLGGKGTSRKISACFEFDVPLPVINHHLAVLLSQNRVRKYVNEGGSTRGLGQKSALWELVS